MKNALPSLIAAGDIASLHDIPAAMAHDAFVQGFGGVMLHGAIGVGLMAAAS